jgi:maltose/maltodextrin transport system substrate-binding protein
MPPQSPMAHFPPTYGVDVDWPEPPAIPRTRDHWLMVPSAVDAALGYLDLYDATRNRKYLDAAEDIAATYVRTQQPDGTWPLMVDFSTGKEIGKQRLIPTWIIMLFDRLEATSRGQSYRGPRQIAWQWIVEHPLRTWQWDAQFEDVFQRPPYANLSREQACDVAGLLLDDFPDDADAVAQAEELLKFAEDQFVVWKPIQDPQGWAKAMPRRFKGQEAWITPCVLEQYDCYAPVARSSAVLIAAYLKAHRATGKSEFRAKALALANSLVAAQEYQIEKHGGSGEVPTWLTKGPAANWLNNSFYAAEALLRVASAERQ